jgi:hypothetical protein
MKIESTAQANRLIQEGVVMRYDLKSVEIYDPKSRVTQCFNCQQYGHIGPACTSQQRCGYCGGQHVTEDCAEKSQVTNKQCAACKVGDHTSWSQACPARQREVARAKQAQRIRPRLYPASTPMTFAFTDSTPATSTRSASVAPEEEWTMVGEKKRRFNQPGRPIGGVGKAKTIQMRPEDRSILSFTQSTSSSTINVPSSQAESLAPEATPADNQMDTEL